MTDKLRAGLRCMAPVAFLLTPALTALRIALSAIPRPQVQVPA